MSLNWWEKNIIYHVYLPSFKDGNNDGIGDFKGLISKLDYFEELKVSTLLLSPFYPSPMKDNGYDITSFVDIDPMYGTMEDFDDLMAQLNARGMNIIIDFVANHTSDQHEWFQKSVLREDPYTDYFIWSNKLPSLSLTPMPPNNWLSVFNGSAWTWNAKRKQFYFHQFLPEQPDLNYRNPLVKEEMKKVLKFWLDKGVDGFRIDAASHLMEDEKLFDEPVLKNPKVEKDDYKSLNHIYTKGNVENLNLLKEWKQLLNDYSPYPEKSKIMLVEAMEDIEDVMFYYGTFESKIAEIPMNFQFYKVKAESTGNDLQKLINDWLSKMPKGKSPNWVMSSHDDPRVVTRIGNTLAGSLHMIMMLLPGIPIWYYGDELGMENGITRPEEMKDSFALRTNPSNSRDPMRTPMLWNGGKNAGFTESDTPWLPINSSYPFKNVEMEKRNAHSFLNNFKKLLAIRDEPAILFSPLKYPIVNDKIFSILRSMVGAKCYLLVLNTSSEPFTANMTTVSDTMPSEAFLELTNCDKYYELQPQQFYKVSDINGMPACSSQSTSYSYKNSGFANSVPSTSHGDECGIHPILHKVIKVPLNKIYLEPRQAIVLSYIG